jgi:hypothetical protein
MNYPAASSGVSKRKMFILCAASGGELNPQRSIKKDKIIRHIINGGYPEVQKIDDPKGRYLWFGSYISTYIERDIRDILENCGIWISSSECSICLPHAPRRF